MVRKHVISNASQMLTLASADPTAKYRPVGSNSMQMQVAGWACNFIWLLISGHPNTCTCPVPEVKNKRLLSLFQLSSFTSNLNDCSARILAILVSIKVTRSSLLPTAMVWPSGDQHMFIFSPIQKIRIFNVINRSHFPMFCQCLIKFTFRVNGGSWFTWPAVPQSHTSIQRCRTKMIWIGRMPTKLIHWTHKFYKINEVNNFKMPSFCLPEFWWPLSVCSRISLSGPKEKMVTVLSKLPK